MLKDAIPVDFRKSAKVLRAKVAERLGYDRYSWPALNGLDRRMAELLPAEGTFLEVGANDGYSQSNTYFLERYRGWSGILIEPLPAQLERCRRLRIRSVCYNLACVSAEKAGQPISLVDRDLTSLILDRQAPRYGQVKLETSPNVSAVNVGSATLSSVIDYSPFEHIIFMSIDVEGAELDLLSGLDDRHIPDYLLVESKQFEALAAALDGRMTLQEQLSHHDYLFVRPSG